MPRYNAHELGHNVIYHLVGGVMVRVGEPVDSESDDNFLIVCQYGDWSGFRSLQRCRDQFPELETSGRPDFWYKVVEKL